MPREYGFPAGEIVAGAFLTRGSGQTPDSIHCDKKDYLTGDMTNIDRASDE
jgi:hypothetical protein